MTIDIIGAGIGGLTTAIALQQKGINVNVFEQAKVLKPVGAGIILANNAMQVYEKLGLREEIEKAGNRVSVMQVTDRELAPISSINMNHFEQKYGVYSIAIHRGALQQILADCLDKDKLFLDHELDQVVQKGDSFQLSFKNGSTHISQILIGTDGIHSRVRRSLFKENTIRNAGQICWRGVADYVLPDSYQQEVNEVWGKGTRFGFVQISSTKVYWFAVKLLKNSQPILPVESLFKEYADYDPIVQNIIQATPTTSIHTAELSDLQPIRTWYKKNVCLMGDAAHAMTPNMGQGACQAIEDAYVLAECLAQMEVNDAFQKYQALRMAKAHQIVKRSWFIGKLAHWTTPLAVGLRNQLMRLMPESVASKQSEQVFELAVVN